MVPLTALWLPIIGSAVLVFVASSLIHMVLKYHKTDYAPVPSEETVAAALRGAPPGDYAMPYASSMKEMSEPAFVERMKAGPVAFLTVRPAGPMNMGRQLALWFAFCLVVSIIAGYVAGRALGYGEEYAAVFRFAGVAAFAAYAVGQWAETIWYGRKLSTTIKNSLDGLVYALLTGGVFGWLWPGGPGA